MYVHFYFLLIKLSILTIFSAIRAEAASIILPSNCAAPFPSFAALSNPLLLLWASYLAYSVNFYVLCLLICCFLSTLIWSSPMNITFIHLWMFLIHMFQIPFSICPAQFWTQLACVSSRQWCILWS